MERRVAWQERLFLTHANLLLDGSTLRLRTESPRNPDACSVAIFPAPASLTDGHSNVPAKDDGLFRRFSPHLAPVASLQAIVEPVQPAGPARTIPIAPSVPTRKQGMAMQPEDADFAQAAVWRVKLPTGVAASRDLRLRVRYTGDRHSRLPRRQIARRRFLQRRPFEIGCAATALHISGRVCC